MRKTLYIAGIAAAATVLIFIGNKLDVRNSSTGEQNDHQDLIRVERPERNALVASPLVIGGEARGNWYFEASFPVRLLDGNDKELGVGIAQAQGDWMTTEFVPFEAKIIFNNPTTTTGTLVLHKDNASGLPEFDDELRVPIRFNPEANLEAVRLYYYNAEKDTEAAGNILCSAKGLEPVERQIPKGITPIKDTLNLFLKGELSHAEKTRGISTEFETLGLRLDSVALSNDGVLKIAFAEPYNVGGGSCRMAILKAQLEATAKQFKEVKQVRIEPDIFQP